MSIESILVVTSYLLEKAVPFVCNQQILITEEHVGLSYSYQCIVNNYLYICKYIFVITYLYQ